jgi:uncharacterized protein YjiS (DUF1127 family)
MSSLAQQPTAAPLRQDHRPRVAARESLSARIVRVLAVWRRRTRSRTQLARLSDGELRDIGLTPAEAARECAKPFWRG